MKSKPHLERLRQQAEERVAKRRRAVTSVSADPMQLVSELEVHQVELEMQNEELLAARAEIEAGLRRYTQLFDFAPIGYALLDPEGRIRSVNLECARMLNVVRADLVDRPFSTYVTIDSRPTLAQCLTGVWRRDEDDEERNVCEVELMARGGEIAIVRVIAAVLREAEPVAMLALHDVTAKKRGEEALREENRRKDEFLATLSHELRNPLAPIRTSLSTVERAAPGSEEATRALAIIRRQVDHLVRIVDDLLDVTRIARGKIVLQKATLDVGDLVRRTAEDYRADLASHDISLDVHVLAAEPLMVDGDAARLAQVLGNLLANALKFTPNGGRVWVEAHRNAEAILSVRDNGAGIAPDMQPRLFDPFFQAPQTLDRSIGGLGLGLATAKGIVDLHGGSIAVESRGLGQGATFTVRLPLAANVVQAAPTPKPQATERRILIVEDNIDAANALRDVLAFGGHEIRMAHDGASALTLARDFHPDIVVCDIGLPGMDGYEVARAMRNDVACKSAYLVALSGYAQPKDRARATEAGFDCHIAKPPDIDELEAVIAKAPRAA